MTKEDQITALVDELKARNKPYPITGELSELSDDRADIIIMACKNMLKVGRDER